MYGTTLIKKWIFISLALIACSASSVRAEELSETEVDPYEGFNRTMFAFNQEIDRYVLKPVAQGYNYVMPKFMNIGITNFFNNLDDVETFANSILQGKLHNAVVSLNRVIWNTTFGLAGFIDVATYFGLQNQEEDFGQTLAFYGYENSSYIVWPFLGPSTFRDTLGRAADTYSDPLYYTDELSSTEKLALTGLKVLDIRADLLKVEHLMAGSDPYVFVRNAYLQNRNYLIRDGVVEDAFANDDLDLEDF
ncbi:hypothetical protein A3715_01515 [Oleiphilus sp. HI0009]|uniref:MlaA family lipoprotein n=1 Tax=unclassified Oleiphilus TaxID=2631174 RepID=UPI0007C3C772|nr:MULTISPECIES: VacJ family lipoprotein [unclassified Oleiphilus]KZX78832.1 hypothetical protein A3715_01515 [Oleiphilus sp. HI0009]KZY69311.1 hypothetical protein A3739_09160 [Oleiphilus sp. HI0067]KZY71845.1 hypothetical protein A3738_14585 [Oleiphilus sp. HI0066]MCH2157744.1 VacJ family lipoprotein [Oleiphilaceae bacterium]